MNRTRSRREAFAMARYWTCYWQYRYWRNDINPEYEPISSSGSNKFRERGVSVGDAVYIVSLESGQLFLGGRMVVKAIVSRPEASRMLDEDRLFETAEEWIIDPDRTGTRLHLRRRLSPEIAKKLQFLLKTGPSQPVFISETKLDGQAARGVREITLESAILLDRIIEITDRIPRSDQLITVTENLLAEGGPSAVRHRIELPEEVPAGSAYSEGSVQRVLVNRYERDPSAREACVRHYGTTCFVCGFDFVAMYTSRG
jgi:hypothetical protein